MHGLLPRYLGNIRAKFAGYIDEAMKAANDDNSWIIIPFELGKIRDRRTGHRNCGADGSRSDVQGTMGEFPVVPASLLRTKEI